MVPEKVRIIMFSGEVMPIKHLQMWQAALPGTEFVNLYGPSEITCNCTYYRINRTFEKTEKLPIGDAFPGRTVFLMDDEGKIVTEPGVSGEMLRRRVTGDRILQQPRADSEAVHYV